MRYLNKKKMICFCECYANTNDEIVVVVLKMNRICWAIFQCWFVRSVEHFGTASIFTSHRRHSIRNWMFYVFLRNMPVYQSCVHEIAKRKKEINKCIYICHHFDYEIFLILLWYIVTLLKCRIEIEWRTVEELKRPLQ